MAAPVASAQKQAIIARLTELARDCDSCEKSWSLHGGGCDERVLLFFDNRDGAARDLAQVAIELGFPPHLLAQWSAALPAADAIGIAVHSDLGSVRLYVQYWDLLIARIMAENYQPQPLYIGFKSLPDTSLRKDVYICQPAAPREIFWPPIAALLQDAGLQPETCAAAFAPLTAETCIYTETGADARQSWLATVRRADLDSAALAAAFAPLAPRLPALVGGLQAGRALVHLAGGTDGSKGRFASFYLESDADEVAVTLLNPASR